MSLKIKLDTLSEVERIKIAKDLTFDKNDGKKSSFQMMKMQSAPEKKEVYAFDVEDSLGGDILSIPFNYGATHLKIARRDMDDCVKMSDDCRFTAKLRDYQKEPVKEVVSYLNRVGSSCFSCYVGFGKTVCAIYIAAKTHVKTLIVVNRLVLLDQWEEEIRSFCKDVRVCKLVPAKIKDDKIPDADFYICNAINLSKFDLSDISFCIVDELHLIITEVLSQGLRRCNPRFLLGLSATPYRTDGLDGLIDAYFGKDKIIKELDRKHTVYRINTGFAPDFEIAKTGNIDWNSLLNSQCYNPYRNRWICEIVKHHSDRVFILMVKRVEQGRMLCKILEEMGIGYDSLLGKERYTDSDRRVLVATGSKASVGFSCKKLNTMVLCSDMGADFYVQAIGRIMRKQDGPEPLFFDLVDNHPSLKRHWAQRSKVYKKHGGEVSDFFKKYGKDFFSCQIKNVEKGEVC